MTSISQSFAYSFTFNMNQNQQQFGNYGNLSSGCPNMANMMQGFGMLFAGMDMIDNGQIDGSVFQMLAGGQPQQANMPFQQGLPIQQPGQPYAMAQAGPNGAFAQAGTQPQQQMQQQQPQNPMQQMMQWFMQMMQMMMMMMMQMMGMNPQQNGFGQQNSPFNNGYNNGFNGGGSPYAQAYAGPNGASASAGTGGNNNVGGTSGPGASGSLINAQPSNATRNPGAGTFGGTKLSQEQVNNARIIAEVGQQKGASKRDIAIAIATAMQESGLRNLNYGDRDSVGLFQQRPSCGWGTVAQCTDPRYAAGKFYDALLKDGNRNNKSLTKAAQDVQRSAYPNAYAKWENMAVNLTNSIC